MKQAIQKAIEGGWNPNAVIITILAVGVVGGMIYWFSAFERSEGHYEKQWQMPAGIVVGGNGQGFGDVSIPTGNAKQVEVWVGDVIKDFIRSNFLPIETVKREIEEMKKNSWNYASYSEGESAVDAALDELARRLFK